MRSLLNVYAIRASQNTGVKLFTATFFRRFLGLLILCCSPVALLANTYYLAPASQGGKDSNNGWSAGSPWLSPNHSLNCGDTIIALPSTSYDAYNFNSSHWGYVSCPNNNNVAWVKCQTFDGCKMYTNVEGINVDRSYWGVQGFEVNVYGGTNGFCFGAGPSYANWNNIHHIIFANNIANGCRGGGISAFNLGNAGVDYFTAIGNIVYNAAQGTDQCYTGISVFEPVQSDWNGGTHIYVAGNFTYGNYQPNYCGGVQAWGGDGIIFDTFDGSVTHMPYPYQAQAVIENNISIGNGGHGIEIQNNKAGSGHANIYISNNTVWGNEQDSAMQPAALCSEILLNSAYNVQERWNLAATKSQKACVNNNTFALSAYDINGSDWVYANLAFAYNSQYTFSWAGPGFGYDKSNVLGVNPSMANPYVPGPPACGGASNATECMQWVVNNVKPTNGAVQWAGYQQPNYSPSNAPLFPWWVCNANIPAGLITKPC